MSFFQHHYCIVTEKSTCLQIAFCEGDRVKIDFASPTPSLRKRFQVPSSNLSGSVPCFMQIPLLVLDSYNCTVDEVTVAQSRPRTISHLCKGTSEKGYYRTNSAY
jgi:hypothetical protein